MSLKKVMWCSISTALLLGFSAATSVWAQKENLSFPLFPNFDSWKIGYSKRAKDTEIVQWVQKTETVDRWTKMVTVQKFKVDKKKGKWSSPLASMEGLKQGTEQRCPTAKWNVIEDSKLAVLYEFKIEGCPQIEDQHELSLLIIGPLTMFRLAYTEKIKELAPEVRDEWLAVLRKTTIEINR